MKIAVMLLDFSRRIFDTQGRRKEMHKEGAHTPSLSSAPPWNEVIAPPLLVMLTLCWRFVDVGLQSFELDMWNSDHDAQYWRQISK